MRTSHLLAAITVAAPLLATAALSAPAHAATTTWTVVNPNSNGAFSAVSGPLVVKNKSGATLFTCPSLSASGSLPAGTRTTSGLGAITSMVPPITCTSPDGTAWQGAFTAAAGASNFTGKSYNATTGTTSIVNGDLFNSINLIFRTAVGYSCGFWTHHTAMTYTNATSTLKATTAVVKLATAEGTPTCQGLLTQGETITFATEYKVTPAIKITATVS
ncbi:hypothetical protein AB0I35_17800 [Nocardia sp. NPDC050378]|uniref:hypothetical protein n=1 Tax=Nocardia sp. NPDC050378 TaxID=3155400 RepID=UPI00340D5700